MAVSGDQKRPFQISFLYEGTVCKRRLHCGGAIICTALRIRDVFPSRRGHTKDVIGVSEALVRSGVNIGVVTPRVTQIKTYSWDNAQVVLVGNKCDLADERAVSVDWGRRLAQQLGGVTQIKTYSWDNAQVVLVGNKCDLADERAVSVDWGRRLAQQLGLEFFEASAKEDVNVRNVFERLVDLIFDKMADNPDNNPAIAGVTQKDYSWSTSKSIRESQVPDAEP
ncbi:hypothetical protein T265_01677 [Opisthorchis viverrini]|uniref:Ras family protein n=1 Tax=Opisthorchis viverrini TaxID=6198 RepID=A0A075A948_OPIVI|nr:hypothetical protein T265_01677 [Opisthorchis viverrini]KER32245.1 hypothetical protein T265_01677 [Opisthorchis viverrini]